MASVGLPAHNVTAGNSCVIATVGRKAAAPTAVTPSDNFGNTWVKIDGVTQNTVCRQETWRCDNLNTTGSMTITITPTGGNSGMCGSAWEFSGMDTSTDKDVSANVAIATGAATLTTGATNFGNELIFAAVSATGGTSTFSAQAFTPNTSATIGSVWNATGTTCSLQSAWEIEGGSTGTQKYVATVTAPGSGVGEIIGTFKAAAAAATGVFDGNQGGNISGNQGGNHAN